MCRRRVGLGSRRRRPGPRALVVTACRHLFRAFCFGFWASRGHQVVA
ncbi:hypothetical protein [Bartonella sp. CL43QHWL]